MSEEQTQQEPCKGKIVVIVLTILSFLFSTAALTTSIIVALHGDISADISAVKEKKVVISKQYDKGQTFEKAKEKNKPMIVFFYTDWCGFCQRFAPTFDKVVKSKKIKSSFAIAYVNCEKTENQALMREYKVEGFPTVYVVDEEGTKTRLDNGIFFGDDSIKAISQEVLDAIDKE